MINYYDVLDVGRNATPDQIKQSFRGLAKKYHPDKNAHRAKWAEEKIRAVIEAHDTLLDGKKRQAYDRRLDQSLVRRRPDDPYAEGLRKRVTDPSAQAKLVLHCLLKEKVDEAVEVFERLRTRMGDKFDLGSYLDLKDYLDCEFLLGEAYEKRGNWREALKFYEGVYNEEREGPVRVFLEEVKDRIRDIYCKKLARKSDPDEAIMIYAKVLSLGIPKKTEAYIHKKIAEAYYKSGSLKKARSHLQKAFALEPKLKGAQKICEKLGVSPGRLSRAASRAAGR